MRVPKQVEVAEEADPAQKEIGAKPLNLFHGDLRMLVGLPWDRFGMYF